MKHLSACILAALLPTACHPQPESAGLQGGGVGEGPHPCADALIRYAERYPAAEPTDLYKLVFQDLYGPGHLLTDSAACAMYIEREVREECTDDASPLPAYEYTLCDSHFVRVNLYLVRLGEIEVGQLTSAVMRSAQGMPSPAPGFVLSHSPAFKAAYKPHYRIVRRDIFERELLPLIWRENQ
ncbi:MAG: hypothetical protein J6I49_01035 [Bacteroidales bacterium]|nr:hypothetical protein [Bacteroidales bacterium]